MNILITEDEIENFIDNYLKEMFGGEVVYVDKDRIQDIRVVVECFVEDRPLPDNFEDEWD